MQIQSTVNKVILAGRVVNEPSYHVANGDTVITFRLITKEGIRRNGQIEPHEEVHQVKANEKVINIDVLKKDMVIYLQGRLNTMQFFDEQKIKRFTTFIVANAIDILAP